MKETRIKGWEGWEENRGLEGRDKGMRGEGYKGQGFHYIMCTLLAINVSLRPVGTPGNGYTFLTTINGHTKESWSNIPLITVVDLGVWKKKEWIEQYVWVSE